jgi:hypothetical protein
MPTTFNKEIITEKVSTYTYSNVTPNVYFGINTSGSVTINGAYKYKEQENRNWHTNDNKAWKAVVVGVYDITDNGSIVNFNSKQPFRAVDYSDKSEVSGWGMPSNKYIDLAVGANGTTYTAPTNGLFCAYCLMSNTNAYLDLNVGGIYNVRIKDAAWNSADVAQIIPVKRGSVLTLQYSGVNFYSFRFIYAEGEV